MDRDIRLALLGDHEAAKRLTDAGVLVPCQRCAGVPKLESEFPDVGYFFYTCSCGIETGAYPTKYEARLAWNTRAPILSESELKKLEKRHEKDSYSFRA